MAKQIRIAVVGKSGNGKSSVANSIIDETVFKTGSSANRITKATSSRTKRLSSGHDIEVFDTPGLYQEDENESEIRKEIEKSTVSPGLHAVVFVIKIGRFTKEEQEAVEQMETLFGTSIFRFTIFAFTCINDLGTQSLERFVHESAPVYLKDVIKKSGSRIVGFDNRDKTMDQESVKKIISLVADMSQTNNECLYSRKLFEEAFQTNMKRKKEEREKKEKERQMQFEKATAEKEAALKKKHEEDRNTFANIQYHITSEQQQYLQETAEKERLSIERENRDTLIKLEEELKSGTEDLTTEASASGEGTASVSNSCREKCVSIKSFLRTTAWYCCCCCCCPRRVQECFLKTTAWFFCCCCCCPRRVQECFLKNTAWFFCCCCCCPRGVKECFLKAIAWCCCCCCPRRFKESFFISST